MAERGRRLEVREVSLENGIKFISYLLVVYNLPEDY